MRILFAAVLIAAATQAHAGNWPTFAGSASRLGSTSNETGITPDTVGNLVQLWSFTLPGTSDLQPLFVENVTTQNGTHNEVFAAADNGGIVAVNAATGQLDWAATLPLPPKMCPDQKYAFSIKATPTIDAATGLMYVVDGTGDLHALAIGTGAEAAGYPVQVIDAANYAAGAYDRGSPTLVGNTLYVTTSGIAACEPTSAFHGAITAFNTVKRTISSTYFPVGNDAVTGAGMWGTGGVMADPVAKSLYAGTGNIWNTDKWDAKSAHGQSVLRLSPVLKLAASNKPPLNPKSDLDFGSTPAPIDVAGCPPMLAVMNKTGGLYVYDRDDLSQGPTQVLEMSAGPGGPDGVVTFIGMVAFDPAAGMVFVDNPIASRDGTYTNGVIALSVSAPSCQLQTAWETQVGTGNFNPQTRSTDPMVAGGLVWTVTGAGDSVMAFNEMTGAVAWQTALGQETEAAVTVQDGEMFIESGASLSAWAPSQGARK